MPCANLVTRPMHLLYFVFVYVVSAVEFGDTTLPNATAVINNAGPVVKNLGEESIGLVNQIPAVVGSDEFPPADEDESIEYATYIIGIFAVFGGIPAFLMCFSGSLYCLIRSVCSSCCCKESNVIDADDEELEQLNQNTEDNPDDKKKKKEEWYRKKFGKQNTGIMRFCLLFLTLGMLCFAAVGYVANSAFMEAISHNQNGAMAVTESLMDELDFFCNYTRTPLGYIRDNTTFLVDQKLIPLLAETTTVENGVTGIINALNAFSSSYNDYKVPVVILTETTSIKCEFCSTISDEVAIMAAELNTKTQPVFDDLSETRTAIEDDLVSMKDEIVEQVNGAIAMIDEGQGQVNDLQDQYYEFEPEVTKFSNLRTTFFIILFMFPLVPFILAMLGCFSSRTLFFTLTTCCTWTASVVILLLCGFHLVFAAVLSDTCEYIDVVTANVSGTIPGDMGVIAQSCLDATPLAVALNLSDAFSFEDSISFPDLPDVSESFDLQQLNDFVKEVDDLQVGTFYSLGDGLIQEANDLIQISPKSSVPVTRGNVASANANTYFDTEPNLTTLTVILANASATVTAETGLVSQFQIVINNMKADITAINGTVNDLREDTDEIQSEFDEAETFVNPVINTANKLMETTTCDFVGNSYRQMNVALCDQLLPAVAAMVLSMMLMSIMSVPVICLSICTKRRLKNKRRADKHKAAVGDLSDHDGHNSVTGTSLNQPMNEVTYRVESEALLPGVSDGNDPPAGPRDRLPNAIGSPEGVRV